MSQQVQEIIARGDARIVDAPARHQVETDRNFGLPTALYGITVGGYLGFIAITGLAFANPVLAIPVVIFGFFIAAGFGIPAIWTRLKGNQSRPMTMGEFSQKGVMTHTGRLTARDATAQVLILPVLLVVWGITAALIAAIVS